MPPKKSDAKRKAPAAAEGAPAKKKSAGKASKKPKTLFDAIVVALNDLGKNIFAELECKKIEFLSRTHESSNSGSLTEEHTLAFVERAIKQAGNPVSLQALKKHLTASREMDFTKTATKNKLKKALEKAISEGKLMKEGSSYMLPAGAVPREELEEAWRQQKILLPIEECDLLGGAFAEGMDGRPLGICEEGSRGQLVVVLQNCSLNKHGKVPDDWSKMSKDEKSSWISENWGHWTGTDEPYGSRIIIPENLHKLGRIYVFEGINGATPSGRFGRWCNQQSGVWQAPYVAEGRICSLIAWPE